MLDWKNLERHEAIRNASLLYAVIVNLLLCTLYRNYTLLRLKSESKTQNGEQKDKRQNNSKRKSFCNSFAILLVGNILQGIISTKYSALSVLSHVLINLKEMENN